MALRTCQRCGSHRILSVSGHCSDSFFMTRENAAPEQNTNYNGYVPSDIGIGESDDLEFDYCLECGQIQGAFPVEQFTVDEAFLEGDNENREGYDEEERIVLPEPELQQLGTLERGPDGKLHWKKEGQDGV